MNGNSFDFHKEGPEVLLNSMIKKSVISFSNRCFRFFRETVIPQIGVTEIGEPNRTLFL